METKVSEKVLSMVKKVYELAKRGVDGEKMNAEVLLQKLLKKHNLTLQDLEQVELTTIDYSLYKDRFWRCYKKIIIQVMYKHTGETGNIREYTSWNGKITIWCNCSCSNSILIKEEIEHYWNDFKIKVDEFADAYIHSNDIYPEGIYSDPKELTQEEWERMERVSQMSDSIQPNSPTRKLQQSNK